MKTSICFRSPLLILGTLAVLGCSSHQQPDPQEGWDDSPTEIVEVVEAVEVEPNDPLKLADHGMKSELERALREDVIDLDGLHPVEGSPDQRTVLHQACLDGPFETIHLLLENGASIEIKDSDGLTAADIFLKRYLKTSPKDSSKKHADSVLAALLRRGYRLDLKADENGLTILHKMLNDDSSPDLVLAVIEEHQVDPDLRDKRGLTLLCHAVLKSDYYEYDFVEMLLLKSASLELTTPKYNGKVEGFPDFPEGTSVLEIVRSHAQSETRELIEDVSQSRDEANERTSPEPVDPFSIQGIQPGMSRAEVEETLGKSTGVEWILRMEQQPLRGRVPLALLEEVLNPDSKKAIPQDSPDYPLLQKLKSKLEDKENGNWPKEELKNSENWLNNALSDSSSFLAIEETSPSTKDFNLLLSERGFGELKHLYVIFLWAIDGEPETVHGSYGEVYRIFERKKLWAYGNNFTYVSYREDKVKSVFGKDLYIGEEQYLRFGETALPGWRSPEVFQEKPLLPHGVPSRVSEFKKEGYTIKIYSKEDVGNIWYGLSN